MPSFESSAARKQDASEALDSGRVSGVRRKMPDLNRAEPPESSLPTLTDEDIIESQDLKTGEVELGPGEYHRVEDFKQSGDAAKAEMEQAELARVKQELAKSGARFSAAQQEGAGHRTAIAQQEATERATGEARLESVRRGIAARGAAAAEKPSSSAEAGSSEAEKQLFFPEGRFISKAEAYSALAKRMSEINRELKDMTAAGHQGFERQEQTLNAEMKELTAALDGVTRATGEATGGLVENPFYGTSVQEAPVAGASGETIKDPFAEKPRTVGEVADPFAADAERMSLGELMTAFIELKQKNSALDAEIKKYEALQDGIIQAISAAHELTAQARENQRVKSWDALARLLREAPSEEELSWTKDLEASIREKVQAAGYPDMLNVLSAGLDKLVTEKGKVLWNLSDVGEQLEKKSDIGQEVQQSIRAAEAAQKRSTPPPAAGTGIKEAA